MVTLDEEYPSTQLLAQSFGQLAALKTEIAKKINIIFRFHAAVPVFNQNAIMLVGASKRPVTVANDIAM